MATRTDDFNRANGSPGANWTAYATAGNWTINTNTLRFQTDGIGNNEAMRWTGAAMDGNDYSVEVTIQKSGNDFQGPGPAGRLQAGALSGYAINAYADAYYLVRVTAGSETTLASWGSGPGTGAVTLRLECEGSTIRMFVAGTQRASVTDATYAAGVPGVMVGNFDASVVTFDNWTAIDFSSGTEYTQSISGALTPSGAAVRQTRRALTGAAGFAGAVVRSISRAVSGAVGFAGEILAPNNYEQALTGALALAGAISKQTNRATSGAVGLAGVISRAVNRALTGAVGIAGALTRSLTYLVSLAGSLRPGSVAGFALQFYGNDGGTGSDVDRVLIPLEVGGSPTAVDVGSGDFTVEMWLNCLYANNTSSGIADARESNIFFDRDIWGDANGHVMGVTRRTGPILAVCFGLAGAGGTWATIYGTTDVGDGDWHHVALVRNGTTGAVQIYVDGVLDASGTYATGDISFAGSGGGGGSPNGSDPYIVLGVEKHDADTAVYLSYYGQMDELRISTNRRYTATFTPPTAPFSVDGNTVGLYHFDDGSGTTLTDSASGVNGTLQTGGATYDGPTWGVSTNPIGGVGDKLTWRLSRLLAGALTPVGGLVKQAQKVLAGAVAFAGSIATTNSFTAELTGALGLAGSVVKQTGKITTGALTPSGAISRAISRTITGALAPAATITRNAARGLQGALTPSGDVTAQSVLGRLLEGALGISGAIYKSTSRSFSGALTPTGAISKSISRALTGSVGFAGSIVKQAQKFLAGALGAAGSIVGDLVQGAIEVVLTGALAFSGAVIKQTNRATLGAVSLAGVVSKSISRAISGAVGLAGGVVTAGKFIGQKFRAMWRGLFKGMR